MFFQNIALLLDTEAPSSHTVSRLVGLAILFPALAVFFRCHHNSKSNNKRGSKSNNPYSPPSAAFLISCSFFAIVLICNRKKKGAAKIE
jgi:hypothetical protein